MNWKRLGNEPIDYSSKEMNNHRLVVSLAIVEGAKVYSFSINEGYNLLYHEKLVAQNIDDAEAEAEKLYLAWKP